MTSNDIIELTRATIVGGKTSLPNTIHYAFASDLMSDVLTQDKDDVLLITGLSNLQTIRTAEMADIQTILIVRGKTVSEEIIVLADELNILLLQCNLSMYHVSGLLYKAGLEPIF